MIAPDQTATRMPSDISGYTGVHPNIHIKSPKIRRRNIDAKHTATGDGFNFLAGYAVTWTIRLQIRAMSRYRMFIVTTAPESTPTPGSRSKFTGPATLNGDGFRNQRKHDLHATERQSLEPTSNVGMRGGSFHGHCRFHTTQLPTATEPVELQGTFTERRVTLPQGFWVVIPMPGMASPARKQSDQGGRKRGLN